MSRKASVIALLVFVALALVVAPTVAICAAASAPCCCGPQADPSDGCPAHCVLESPDPAPQTTPEPVRTVQPILVLVAETDDIALPAPVPRRAPTTAPLADEFPNESLLAFSDATRAPPPAV